MGLCGVWATDKGSDCVAGREKHGAMVPANDPEKRCETSTMIGRPGLLAFDLFSEESG